MISYIVLIIASIFLAGPFIIILFASLKGQQEIMHSTSTIFPERIQFFWYRSVLSQTDFLLFIKNSVGYASMATVLGLVISSLAAYAITRHTRKIQKVLTRSIILTYMFPQILLAIPYYLMVSKLGLVDSVPGLLMAYMSFTVPFCTYLMVGYFKSLPKDIEEAAHIDGLSRTGTFFRISLPLVAPGLVATAIFAFINAWNEFLFSLLILSSRKKQTVGVGLYSLMGGGSTSTLQWGDKAAACVLVVVPSLIFFSIIQKSIAAGLTSGAIK
ncbi:MAG: carbohydrate ABC transporter permease [Clostridiaceae bacterium]|nr:carbohydrate ABC transporter permease [Clostridiaceae bacterium]